MKHVILKTALAIMLIIGLYSCGKIETFNLQNPTGKWTNVTCNCNSNVILYNDGSCYWNNFPNGSDGAYLFNFYTNKQQIDFLNINGKYLQTVNVYYDNMREQYYFDLPTGTLTKPNGTKIDYFETYYLQY